MMEPMVVCNDADASGRGQRVPTALEIGRKCTREYMRKVFETQPKSCRLEIASEIRSLEVEHYRTINRIKKTHQLAAKLEADETTCAALRKN